MKSDNRQKISDNRVARLVLSHYGETKGGLAERLTQRIANPCLETRIPINKTRRIRVVSKSDNRAERFGNVQGMLTTAPINAPQVSRKGNGASCVTAEDRFTPRADWAPVAHQPRKVSE